MSETTDIAVLEIKPEQAPTLYVPNGLDSYLEQIRQQVNEVPDVTTKKGRDRIGSLARMVGSRKKAIEEPCRNYLRQLKEAVKPAEEELRRFTRECDLIRDEILAPRAEWDAEQERIAAEKTAEEERQRIAAEELAAAEALKKQIESDHEIALLLNDRFDRDAKEAAAEAERQRIAREEEIKRQEDERVRVEAEAAVQRERNEATQREAALKAQAAQAERDRLAAQQKAEREAKEAAERAERQRIEAEQRAEREKQEAIATERRRAEQAEAARLAEEKRIADEAAARAADEVHRRVIGTAVVNALIANAGLSREDAIATLVALKGELIPHTRITY